jgi:hypothetical protein
MTDHVRRLYLAAGSLLAFFLAWAGIAAHPWTAASPTASRASAVATYDKRLRADAVLLRQLSSRTRAAAAAAPRVRIVNLPPLTITRTS